MNLEYEALTSSPSDNWDPPPPPPDEEWDHAFDPAFLQSLLHLWLGWWSLISVAIAILAWVPAGFVTSQSQSHFIGVLILLDYFRLPSGKMVVASLRVGGTGLLNAYPSHKPQHKPYSEHASCATSSSNPH